MTVARRLPLRGADLVLLAMPALWRGHAVSNNVLLAVECDGPIDAARVRLALERFAQRCPWVAGRLRRRFPWGKLHWDAKSAAGGQCPPVRVARLGSPEAFHAVLESELNARIDPWREPPLRVLIAECDAAPPGARDANARGALVLTWFHPLMDPRGGQNLLMHLARLDEGDTGAGAALLNLGDQRDPRPLAERGRIARRSLEHMRTLGAAPPVSPGTALGAPGRARFRLDRFAIPDQSRDRRVTREICWRLAVVGRAMARLWERRGLPAGVPFLVAVAVDQRPKGDSSPALGNRLAFHFARFAPADTGDVAALARALRRQMADAVRDGQIEANAVAMEFLHYRPISRMLRAMPGAASRETFSFNCADVADFPSPDAMLFGRRIVNAYHVPAVSPRPGIGVFFNRCGGTDNLVTAWIEGAVSEDEVEEIALDVRRGMGWTDSR